MTRSGLACAVLAWAGFIQAPANADEREQAWVAGAYSFSDELGGFRITGISGTGAKEDPIVIVEEFNSASPVTMVIRATRPLGAFAFGDYSADGFTHFRIVVLNNSGQAWVEFEFELQERLGRASLFGDGLSFDQRRAETNAVTSENFALNRRDFEPYDRLRFVEGKVDPLKTGRFSFLVTDFTPRATYYLLQDPRIPFS